MQGEIMSIEYFSDDEVNQDFAVDGSRIAAGDEIAFFPPVTGG